MEGNMDQHIREKLQEREIQPSASSWERLASQLDEAETKKKRHWFFYVGYAASILLLISLVFVVSKEKAVDPPIPDNVIVKDDITQPEKDQTKQFISMPEEQVVVELENKEIDKEKIEKVEMPKDIRTQTLPFKSTKKERSVVASRDKKPEIKVDINQKDFDQKLKELTKDQESVVVSNDRSKSDLIQKMSKGQITVDSDALLMSVTSTKEELRAYYKKYKIDRTEVLLAIQKELKKSNVKVDPESILAEVELDVNEENFQNNFYRFIKKRVSTVATAIANRNN